MDWSKTKIVLIVIFLILNIVLLTLILIPRLEDRVSGETISNVKKVLQSNGVILKHKIPNSTPDNAMLAYETGRNEVEGIARYLMGNGKPALGAMVPGDTYRNGTKKLEVLEDYTLKYSNSLPQDTVDINSKKESEKYARRFISEFGIDDNSFVLDSFSSDSSFKSVSLEFKQKFKGHLVFDNYFKFTISRNGICALECKYRKPESLKAREKKIIPAYAILLKNYASGKGVVITDIDLGFKGYMSVAGTTTQRYEYLVWRIRLEDGTTDYYKASDGVKISDLPK